MLQYYRSAVPPIRSDFPDYGPNPDFFVETGPERVRIVFKKSEFILKELIEQRIRCFYADIIVGQQDYLHSSALQS